MFWIFQRFRAMIPFLQPGWSPWFLRMSSFVFSGEKVLLKFDTLSVEFLVSLTFSSICLPVYFCFSSSVSSCTCLYLSVSCCLSILFLFVLHVSFQSFLTFAIVLASLSFWPFCFFSITVVTHALFLVFTCISILQILVSWSPPLSDNAEIGTRSYPRKFIN